MNLKERVQTLCKEKGVTAQKVESDLGFGKGYISKLNASVPNAANIQKMATYFGVTVGYLLGVETEKKPTERGGRSAGMNYLKKLRIEKGVSQQSVADFLGITRQAYSNYENDNRDPDKETLLKLAEFFGTSVDVILRGKEIAPAEDSKRPISDDDLMFALWGDTKNIDEGDLEDVRRYAEFIRERKEKK